MSARETDKVRRGGRPSRLQAGQLEARILDCAAHLFLNHGYGATSIEAIAKRAGISKRTFYHRFQDKADVFAAVVHRLVSRLRPQEESHLFDGDSLAAILVSLAKIILHASLTPDAIRLHRLLLCEAERIPELAAILGRHGARQEAIDRIAGLLQQETGKGHIAVADPHFAAEQFLQMVISAPQRRAMGLGAPMSDRELDDWAANTVDLFLQGCRPAHPYSS